MLSAHQQPQKPRQSTPSVEHVADTPVPALCCPSSPACRGQLYIQLGIPKSGPALAPGSVITQPTGDVRGNGAYATQLIPAGTHIADYAGEVLSNAEFFSRYADGVVSALLEAFVALYDCLCLLQLLQST